MVRHFPGGLHDLPSLPNSPRKLGLNRLGSQVFSSFCFPCSRKEEYLMRSTLCLAMLLFSTVAVAAEPSTAPSGRGGVLRQARPLHRHPTLIGMLRRNNEMRRRAGLGGHRLNPALTKA